MEDAFDMPTDHVQGITKARMIAVEASRLHHVKNVTDHLPRQPVPAPN